MIKQGKKGVIVIEGHVQGLANTRLLGKAGIPVIVIDKENCVARYSKYCQKFFRCPDYISEKFINFLIMLAQAENLKGWLLLPSNDHAVYNIAKNKKTLSEFFRIITDDFEVINKIYHKCLLLDIAQKAGIPIPQSYIPEQGIPDFSTLHYPVIIKGNNGLSFYKKYHKKAFFANSEEELRQVLSEKLAQATPSEYFIQEVLPDKHKTISATVFAVNGQVYVYWMGEKLREHPIRFGTATCCRSIFNFTVLEQSKAIVKELNFTGVCEIEWLKDPRDDQYKLIEINARTWLWVGLAEKCGINYPLIIYNYLMHGVIPKPNEYTLGLNWINVYTDFYFSLKSIFKRTVRFKDFVSSYRKFTEACWDKTDPLPFFIYGIFLFNFNKNR